MKSALKKIGISCGVMFATVAFGDHRLEHLGRTTITPATGIAPTAIKVELGKKLFFDKRLSADGSISCASCHQPERAFSDGLKTSIGIGGQIGTRNAPSLLNATLMGSQFWDGRRSSLESQALDPFVHPKEHGFASSRELVEIVRHDREYSGHFHDAFGIGVDSISPEHIAKAIASFEQSIASGNSSFDRYYYGEEQSALSPAARRGLLLFTGRAQCVACHLIGTSNSTFSDNEFHSLGIGLDRIENRLSDITKQVIAARHEDRSINATAISEADISELGRFFVTLDPADIGKFRTPSLRNVALTAPYMHDGSVATLEQAIDHEIYYRGAQNGRPLILTPAEKMDLAEFLRGLTSQEPHGGAPP